MFTANSMNCLTEAIGLSLPGNGSVLATHTARKALYEDAGRTVVDITRRYYEQDDETVLPRSVAIARRVRERHGARHRDGRLHQHHPAPAGRRPGGRAGRSAWPTSTPSRAGCRACRRSRRTSLGGTYYMEDVHRAGGIPAILGELYRGGLLNEDVHSVHSASLAGLAEDTGTSAAARRPPRRSNSGTRPPAASAPPPRSRSRSAGSRWTTTPRAAASATSSTPTPRTAASPYCAATSPRTAAW